MLEKGLYISGKKKSYRGGFVKYGNERCGHTECCDIKRGLVMSMAQAVSRPSIKHIIYYYYYKSTDGLDCRKEYKLSIDSLVYSLESHGCSVSNAPLRIRGPFLESPGNLTGPESYF